MSLFPKKQAALGDLVTNQTEATIIHAELQTILLEMQRFGKPRLHCHDDNLWSCHIDVSVSPLGAKFEVRSDFQQKTPVAAAMQCSDRLFAAIASLKTGA